MRIFSSISDISSSPPRLEQWEKKWSIIISLDAVDKMYHHQELCTTGRKKNGELELFHKQILTQVFDSCLWNKNRSYFPNKNEIFEKRTCAVWKKTMKTLTFLMIISYLHYLDHGNPKNMYYVQFYWILHTVINKNVLE